MSDSILVVPCSDPLEIMELSSFSWNWSGRGTDAWKSRKESVENLGRNVGKLKHDQQMDFIQEIKKEMIIMLHSLELYRCLGGKAFNQVKSRFINSDEVVFICCSMPFIK